MKEAERIAATAREQIDGLASDIGGDVEVLQDELLDCAPGDRDSGKSLSYQVEVTSPRGGLSWVRGDLKRQYERQGWTVYDRTSRHTAFRNGDVSANVLVRGDGSIVVSGSGGCVRQGRWDPGWVLRKGRTGGRKIDRHRLAPRIGLLLLALIVLVGCSKETDMEEAERVADEARSEIRALAALVGPRIEIQHDQLLECTPGDEDSGRILSFAILVKADPDTQDRVRGEVADRYRADGWTVSPRGSDDTAFRKGSTTMSVAMGPDGTTASVGGSGGCVQ